MTPTRQLHDLGQSLWLDNITRDLLDSGTLRRYIDELSITGLTSNPTIFDEAIGKGGPYDAAIRKQAGTGTSTQDTFVAIALEDLRRAADLFRPIFDATGGIDGWVSMEVSPLLADDTAGTVAAAKAIHAQAQRPNLFVKIPGTPAGVPAIEEAIFCGSPVNVTLLFSHEQYLAAAQAYLRGIRRRIDAGLNPRIASVASLFISRWDRAIADKVPTELRNRLGLAVAQRCYCAYRELLDSACWQSLAQGGAIAQRLLWASTGVKDPQASETLYVESLAAPDTINTMPEKTLLAFAKEGRLRGAMQANGAAAERKLRQFAEVGIDIDRLAAQLQLDAAGAFVKSWTGLMQRIVDKSQ